MTQTWMNQRFMGLVPGDFEDGVHFLCIVPTAVPPDFHDVWHVYQRGQDVSTLSALKDKRAIVIFASPVNAQQVATLQELVQAMDANYGSDAPPMIWAPHSVAPEVRLHNAVVEHTGTEGKSLVTTFMEMGVDGIVSGEPHGYALALAVRVWVHKLEMISQNMTEVMHDRAQRAQNLDYLKDYVDGLLWDFLRNRLAPAIPPCDRSLPTGEPNHIDGFTFGSCRRTPHGPVYRLIGKKREAGTAKGSKRQAAKLIDKLTVRDVSGVSCVKRMVDALWMVSCEKWQHPHIQRLFQVYHSPTHIILRVEYGGGGSLYARLARRASQDKLRPLSFTKTSQIIQQVLRAVAHLHLGPKVCHRDIKPENFDLHETPDNATVKLTNFELAFVQDDASALCRQVCGTIPFMAPEILQYTGYNGMAVDIWSTGVTLFELLCGLKSLEDSLNLIPEDAKAQGRHCGYSRPDESLIGKLMESFQQPGSAGRLLKAQCLQDLDHFLPSVRPMIDGTLKVYPEERWSAIDLQAAMEMLPKALPGQSPMPASSGGEE